MKRTRLILLLFCVLLITFCCVLLTVPRIGKTSKSYDDVVDTFILSRMVQLDEAHLLTPDLLGAIVMLLKSNEMKERVMYLKQLVDMEIAIESGDSSKMDEAYKRYCDYQKQCSLLCMPFEEFVAYTLEIRKGLKSVKYGKTQ